MSMDDENTGRFSAQEYVEPGVADRPIIVMKKSEPSISVTPVAPSVEKVWVPAMKRPCSFVNSDLQLTEAPLSWLGDGKDYLVVAAVGRQGVGKSTVLSMLADPPFQPGSCVFPAEAACDVARCQHRTRGIDMLVTSQRLILLDTQPLLSPSVLECITNPRTSSDSTGWQDVELMALELLAFLYTVCHVVLVVQDSFVDSDVVKLLQSAEMVKPNHGNLGFGEPHDTFFPRLVFVHNYCNLPRLLPDNLHSMQNFYQMAFGNCGVSVNDGVGVGSLKPKDLADQGDKQSTINLIAVPKLLPDNGDDADSMEVLRTGRDSIQQVVRSLRSEILKILPKPLSRQVSSEKQWYHYAARVWEGVQKHSFLKEYGRLVR